MSVVDVAGGGSRKSARSRNRRRQLVAMATPGKQSQAFCLLRNAPGAGDGREEKNVCPQKTSGRHGDTLLQLGVKMKMRLLLRFVSVSY